ncbi:hypothetical protein K435DRAFT_809323 [Dendrothele bispora CBS 962.96]|uniref:Uncharacterized protein n=1 Tax=Dendrothele bispora (strain CBS 962.96) TaxID=1314807 RepID=A0A4S8KYM6_DENBC|nr:hypothetical protein K435DRAFT_809323 [Dendrothele bispora CBS 962.96]
MLGSALPPSRQVLTERGGSSSMQGVAEAEEVEGSGLRITPVFSRNAVADCDEMAEGPNEYEVRRATGFAMEAGDGDIANAGWKRKRRFWLWEGPTCRIRAGFSRLKRSEGPENAFTSQTIGKWQIGVTAR